MPKNSALPCSSTVSWYGIALPLDYLSMSGLHPALYPSARNSPPSLTVFLSEGNIQSSVNEWYRELAKEWEDVIVATAKLSEEYEIEIWVKWNSIFSD